MTGEILQSVSLPQVGVEVQLAKPQRKAVALSFPIFELN